MKQSATSTVSAQTATAQMGHHGAILKPDSSHAAALWFLPHRTHTFAALTLATQHSNLVVPFS